MKYDNADNMKINGVEIHLTQFEIIAGCSMRQN
jgi:hypothetical protein